MKVRVEFLPQDSSLTHYFKMISQRCEKQNTGTNQKSVKKISVLPVYETCFSRAIVLGLITVIIYS